jgi:predicted nicotinamide N-methyase
VAGCCSSELGAESGWVPVAAAAVGSLTVLAAAVVPYSECRTQSRNAKAELKVLPEGSSSSFLPSGL